MLDSTIAAPYLQALETRLLAVSKPATKDWWDRYLKGVIPFRGVVMGDIRAAMHAWWLADGVAELGVETQKELALALLRAPWSEDKLAGILALRERLLATLSIADLPAFAALFQEGWVADWNTCDWLCTKVFTRMIVIAEERETLSYAFAAWRTAPNLWQRRAAGVVFVNLAKQGDNIFPGFVRMLLEICSVTVQSPERFAQTGVGWVLRELSLADRAAVMAFVQSNAKLMSREGVHYAAEKMPAELKQELLALHSEQTRQRKGTKKRL